ncbi:Permease of the drug/metabolite transporter (DMT) superfamily [Pseudorhodobacter antarcticus]|uniref:Permease of the drug/metabolite transporter (DMT) superfamily n=1 Tax=Pseudorhodobacter antarcticus TaxID=1077947 RepID=A0A1H8AXU2_9RHOB|nr:DMT family transporter [Pseudorhodobacter antarcticus]SEM75572.1 Permease of the drug/metabolite transporter (DMT) superfamily [Pseudorhodobacter antarcticus]
MTQPTRRDWLSILFLGLVWGGTFMVVSFALRGYGPITVATARVVLGALALASLAAALGRPMPAHSAKLWAHILPIGLLSSAIPFTLLSWGQTQVPSAFAGLSMAAVPLLVLPLAYIFAGETLHRFKAAGFGLGFLGTLILLGPDILTGGPLVLPRLACIAAALCYAVASVLTRRCPPIDPITLAALSLTVGAVTLTPLMLVTEGVPTWAGPIPGTAIILLGLVPTALAALLRVSVIRSAGSGFMTLTSYQVPVWSVVFGVLVLNEELPLRFFAALALILAGLLLSQRKPG